MPRSACESGHKVDGSRSIVGMAVRSTPLLTSSGGSTPDTYGADERIRLRVTFNVAVDVTGDPVLTFALGNSGDTREVDAAYESRTGTAELVFGYTVVSDRRGRQRHFPDAEAATSAAGTAR